MRIRATVAAVTGALALSAFAVPAAQADDQGDRADAVQRFQQLHAAQQENPGASQRTARAAAEPVPAPLNLTFSNVKINNGKPIVVGTTNIVRAPVTYTLNHTPDFDPLDADVEVDAILYRGDLATTDDVLFDDDWPVCQTKSTVVSTCTTTIDIYPREELQLVDATTWKLAAYAIDYNGQDPMSEDFDVTKMAYSENINLGATKLQRYSTQTVNAAPEPVKKGATITVTGKLARANWETHTYKGYTGQPVKLEFRKKTSSTYTHVKTVTTNSTGSLKTTVKAATDGYWRWSFAGTSTTPAVKAAGDFVDVK